MTDGIIQEVFKKYYIDFEKGLDDPYFAESYMQDINLLKQIQQELIEKIKQEFALSYEFNNDITIIKTLRIKLIGDNQE